MGKIDMSKYHIRTDLVLDELDGINDESIKVDKRKLDDIRITNVEVKKEYENRLNKKKGKYITIEFDDVTDYENRKKVIKVFCEELKILLEKLNLSENDECLVIGLGNEKSTPDSLGPKTINDILVTKHLFSLEKNKVDSGFRCVSAFNPGVMGVTGIETSELIKNIIDTVKPKFVIVIDALAASSISRVNKTIQMTDSGIHPGSGVGNSRKEISKSVLGIPVIAIGIPTVVDAVTIVSDTIDYMIKHFSYIEANINNPANKLAVKKTNYLKKNLKEMKKADKKKYVGLLGELNDEEIHSLIYEVLSPIDYNLMVTPKEVDFVIDKLSNVLSSGINQVLHKKIKDRL